MQYKYLVHTFEIQITVKEFYKVKKIYNQKYVWVLCLSSTSIPIILMCTLKSLNDRNNRFRRL